MIRKAVFAFGMAAIVYITNTVFELTAERRGKAVKHLRQKGKLLAEEIRKYRERTRLSVVR